MKSIEIFHASIRSQKTKQIYQDRLKQFFLFKKIKDADSYLLKSQKEIETDIIEYISYLKKKIEKKIIGPNAIPQRIAPIELFLSQNDIVINQKKIHRTYPRRVKIKGEEPYKLQDIQSMVKSTTKPRDLAMIGFFSSTGARPGAALELKLDDMKEIDDCLVFTLYRDDPEEYPVFLTPEATRYMRRYLKEREFHGEKLTPDSPVFRNVYRRKEAWRNVKSMNEQSFKSAMYDIILRAGLRHKLKDSGHRHKTAIFGGFRKWFETTLNNISDINSNVVEKLMGHKNDLRGTYYNPDIEKRFSEFKKAIPELTISAELRLKADNQKKQSKIDKFEKYVDKIELMQKESLERKENYELAKKIVELAIKDPEIKKKLEKLKNE